MYLMATVCASYNYVLVFRSRAPKWSTSWRSWEESRAVTTPPSRTSASKSMTVAYHNSSFISDNEFPNFFIWSLTSQLLQFYLKTYQVVIVLTFCILLLYPEFKAVITTVLQHSFLILQIQKYKEILCYNTKIIVL